MTGTGQRRSLANRPRMIAPSTVWEILKGHGIDPAPRRARPDWAQFLRSRAEAILALDPFAIDLLDGTKAYVLAAIGHATRRIRILGATAHRGGQWIVQQARRISPMRYLTASRGSPRSTRARSSSSRTSVDHIGR
jgi:hypothetical protein